MPSGARPKDISGNKYNRLTAIRISHRNKHGFVMWECSCECGNLISVASMDLRSGHTKSCGCLKIELLKKRVTKHGSSKTQIYEVWSAMIARCHSENNKSYKHYGGRGIEVCREWRDSFEKFSIDMGNRPMGMTIERKDNNVGYNKDNCIWAKRLDQANNMRSNLMVVCELGIFTLAQFSRNLGSKYARVRSAIIRGVRSLDGVDFYCMDRMGNPKSEIDKSIISLEMKNRKSNS